MVERAPESVRRVFSFGVGNSKETKRKKEMANKASLARELRFLSAVALVVAALCVLSAPVQVSAQGSEFVAGVITTNAPATIEVNQVNGSSQESVLFYLRPFDNDDNVTDVRVLPQSDDNSIITCATENCPYSVEITRDVGQGYTVFNITVTFEFDYLPGQARYELEVYTDRRTGGNPNNQPYKSEGDLPIFQVFGLVLLAPGTDRENPGNPENPRIVSGELYELYLGTYEDTLPPNDTYRLPVVSRWTSTDTRFPYDDLATAEVVAPLGRPQNQTSNRLEEPYCAIYVSNEPDYELEAGCGFVFLTFDDPLQDVLLLKINPYRVGMFDIVWDGDENLEIDDTIFQTLLQVEIKSPPIPPPVSQFKKTYIFDYFGWEIFPWELYNLVDPPRPSNDTIVGGALEMGNPSENTGPQYSPNGQASVRMNLSYTELDLPIPSFLIYFVNLYGLFSVNSSVAVPEVEYEPNMIAEFATSGRAEIVQLNQSVVTYSSPELCVIGVLTNPDASKNLMEFSVIFLKLGPESTSNNTCTKVIEAIMNHNPNTFGKYFEKIVPTNVKADNSRRVQSLDGESLRQVEAGGSEIFFRAIVPADTDNNNVRKELDDYLDSEEFALNVRVDPSWVRKGEAPSVITPTALPSGSANPGGAGGGLATWAIAVISVIAALLLILIIAVALFLILANKEEEDTESSYSSEGPALVPRPDDIMYQQAIVRDEYGRGEFSEPIEGDELEMENGIRAEYPRIVA